MDKKVILNYLSMSMDGVREFEQDPTVKEIKLNCISRLYVGISTDKTDLTKSIEKIRKGNNE